MATSALNKSKSVVLHFVQLVMFPQNIPEGMYNNQITKKKKSTFPIFRQSLNTYAAIFKQIYDIHSECFCDYAYIGVSQLWQVIYLQDFFHSHVRFELSSSTKEELFLFLWACFVFVLKHQMFL